jgi:hypothetical protein
MSQGRSLSHRQTFNCAAFHARCDCVVEHVRPTCSVECMYSISPRTSFSLLASLCARTRSRHCLETLMKAVLCETVDLRTRSYVIIQEWRSLRVMLRSTSCLASAISSSVGMLTIMR